ncbi:MAG: DMT family transporter [Lutibacter sp.]
MKSNYKAHLALLGANFIYGANHLIAKGVMPNKIGPSAFVFLRVLGAGVLFWIIRIFIKEKIDKSDYLKFLICGIFGVATNQLLFLHGLSITSPIDASIIITAVPVLVLIFSHFLLKERITLLKLVGILIGGIGAVLLVTYGSKEGGTSSFLGNIFIFVNAISYGFYLVFVKPLMKKYHPITVISAVFLCGFIFILPFGIPDIVQTNFAAFTFVDVLIVLFVVFCTTFLTYLFNIYALTKVSPSVNGSYIYLQPVISFIMVAFYAYIFANNKYANDINIIKIASCLMVIAGVYLISKQPKIELN